MNIVLGAVGVWIWISFSVPTQFNVVQSIHKSFHIEAESRKEWCILTGRIQKDFMEGWIRFHTQQCAPKPPYLADFSLFPLHLYFLAIKCNSSLQSSVFLSVHFFFHANYLVPGPTKTECLLCMHWSSNSIYIEQMRQGCWLMELII